MHQISKVLHIRKIRYQCDAIYFAAFQSSRLSFEHTPEVTAAHRYTYTQNITMLRPALDWREEMDENQRAIEIANRIIAYGQFQYSVDSAECALFYRIGFLITQMI